MSMRPTPNGGFSVAEQLREASIIATTEIENLCSAAAAAAGDGGDGGGRAAEIDDVGGMFVGAPFAPHAEDAAREVYLGILHGEPKGRKQRVCAEVAPAFRDLFDATEGARAHPDAHAGGGPGVGRVTAVISGVCEYGARNVAHSDGSIIMLYVG